MDIFIKILQLIVSLSLLVVIHELGHFSFARLFKIRVDKFYMFFNINYSLVRFKKFNGKWHVCWFSKNLPDHVQPKLDEFGNEVKDKKGRTIMIPAPIENLADDDWRKHPETTEWGIGWLPLGGYCKIAGMIDESMDTEQLKREPQAWEYRSKPAWQRLLVIVGGVMFNVFLAILIYWGMLFTWGEQYIANKDVVNGITVSKAAEELGLRNGDKIISVDGQTFDRFNDITMKLLLDNPKTITVNRNGENVDIKLPEDATTKVIKSSKSGLLISPRTEFVVGYIPKDSPALKSDLKVGDAIVGVDTFNVKYFDEVTALLPKYKAQDVKLTVIRNGEKLSFMAPVTIEGKIGVVASDKGIKYTQINYGFFEAFPKGISKGAKAIKDYVKQLGLIFTPKTEAYKEVGSFIAIGNIFPGQWIWEAFWALTAMLSIMLAVVNIIPIPGLDGGHLMFILYEMIFRRKPSDKFLEYAQMVGMFIILAIFVLAMGNDIMRFLIK